MSRPLVSIVIPCFNYGRYLGQAISSALGQTHQPVEVIVVDDGSTDDTAKVAKSFGDKISYNFQANSGVSAARNLGLSKIHGDYAMFLDADDWLEPTYVEQCLAELAAHPGVDFVYTQMKLFGKESVITKYPKFSIWRLKLGNYINNASLFRANTLKSFRFNEDLKSGWEDYDLYLSLVEAKATGHLLNLPLLNYRKHDSRTDTIDLNRERQLMRQMILLHPGLFSPLTKLLIKGLYFVRSHRVLEVTARKLKRLVNQ